MTTIAKEELYAKKIEPANIEHIDNALALKNSILPISLNGENRLLTTKEHLANALSFAAFHSAEQLICATESGVYEELKNRIFSKEREELDSHNIAIDETAFIDPFSVFSDDILADENAAPVIRFVNSIFYEAVKQRVSDIHIESRESGGVVRFRVDGSLIDFLQMKPSLVKAVIGRIKVVSNLDISEKRVPQDGRINLSIQSRKLDVRVSTLPTFYGEKAVMRLLLDSDAIPSLEELGFDAKTTDALKTLVGSPYGMVIVTGPTGSGKTTTLHSILKTLDNSEKNVVSIEDPIEYKAKNITQIQVNEAVGLTFASGLRAILRQDPDIIMVGEIRDKETAKLAVRAALTGHLTFSTLHTNSAVSAVSRLRDVGIEEFLISSSLVGILAQRLIRKLCPHCKTEEAELITDELLTINHPSKAYTSVGCKACRNTGFLGRIAVGEILFVDSEIRAAIAKKQNENELLHLALKKGMKTIKTSLKELVLSGESSLLEAKKALFLNG